MEISECLLLPKKCYHEKRCHGYYCRKIGGQQCVHAVMYEGKLQAMYGRDLYQLIDKDHPEYEHLYKLYDEEYLDALRQVDLERNKINRQEFLKQEEIRKANLVKVEQDRQNFYLHQASMTSELKISRV